MQWDGQLLHLLHVWPADPQCNSTPVYAALLATPSQRASRPLAGLGRRAAAGRGPDGVKLPVKGHDPGYGQEREGA